MYDIGDMSGPFSAKKAQSLGNTAFFDGKFAEAIQQYVRPSVIPRLTRYAATRMPLGSTTPTTSPSATDPHATLPCTTTIKPSKMLWLASVSTLTSPRPPNTVYYTHCSEPVITGLLAPCKRAGCDEAIHRSTGVSAAAAGCEWCWGI